MTNHKHDGDVSMLQPSLYIPMEIEFIDDIRWEHLLEYHGTVYHLVLRKNLSSDECVENRLLREIYETELAGDDEGIDKVSLKIVEEHFRPFLLANKLKSGPGEAARVNLQLRTVKGQKECTTHSLTTFDVDESSFFIEDELWNVKKISADKVTKLEEITAHIYKVTLNGSNEVYVLKSALRMKLAESFRNEIDTLIGIKKYKNVVPLVGLSCEEDGKVSGIILPFIEGKVLCEIEQASKVEKDNWVEAIKGAVKHIHGCGRVWGDAKAGNILITNDERKVMLFDFEGGYTTGWVDKENAGTQLGDWQGVGRIVKFIERIDEV